MGTSYRPWRKSAKKSKILIEEYRPSSGSGVAIQIRYAGKLTPEEIRRWKPVARVTAVLALHIRDRIRDRSLAHDGQKMGPGKISGGMWRGLATSVTAKGRARVYFRGQSVSYQRDNKGGYFARKDSQGREIKVKNEWKATNVSGLGMVPPRSADGSMMRGRLVDTENYGRAVIPKGYEPPRHKAGTRQGGRWKRWPLNIRQQVQRMVPQRFASGRHRPVSALKPSEREMKAVRSVLLADMKRRSMSPTGGQRPVGWNGDRRLIQSLRRAMSL
tara:strand:+ start:299 stop:1117 length:819 start_codon:yes stop_codon:yes gene_type:complete